MDCRVYLLGRILDDPRFEGFASCRDRGFLPKSFSVASDFVGKWVDQTHWKPPVLADVWKPLAVIGRVREHHDFPCLNMTVPAFSARAVAALKDILEENGELLPLKSKVGTYYAYNVTTVADVLNRTRSRIRWDTEVTGDNFNRYEFHESKVRGLSIFRIPEDTIGVYVTETFATRVRRYQLQGFDLALLWPLPAKTNWRQLARMRKRERERSEFAGGQPKGHALVIRFRVAAAGGTADEQRRLGAFMNQLDKRLASSRSTTFLGSVEGREDLARESRIYLSCPDVDALAVSLRPWLDKLQWKRGFVVVKRYGNFADPGATEEYMPIGDASRSKGVRST